MKKVLLLMAGLALAGTMRAEWGSSMESPVTVFPSGTNSYMTVEKVSPEGGVWAMIYHPNLADADDEYDTDHVVYEYRLQYFDANGIAQFPDEGMLLSDYANISWTVVNDLLLVDSDGNAVVAVSDARNSNDKNLSFTAYKISQTGDLLWGEDGVALSDSAKPVGLVASMSMVQLEDGSYVFAWSEMGETDSHVYMQRLSNDGKPQWNLDKVSFTEDYTIYPYIVNSGDNTFILVYARTSSMVLYARKLDFEAESVWGKDIRIYRGGWGSIPLWTLISVRPSGDGGVLVSWTDDRTGSRIESAYMSYVTADGKLGFAGASDEGDVKLCYDYWRCFNLATVPAADGSGFYAIWRTTDGNQLNQGIKMQKVSKDGELLWGDEAKALEEATNTHWGYVSIQQAGEDGFCAFYEEYVDYFNQQSFAARFDKNGEPVWADSPLSLSVSGRQVTSLESHPFTGNKAWLCTWTDGGAGADDKSTTYYMTKLNENGTFGNDPSGVSVVDAGNPDRLCFRDRTIYANAADGSIVNVYDTTGACVATAVITSGSAALDLPCGLYMAAVNGKGTLKFVVR